MVNTFIYCLQDSNGCTSIWFVFQKSKYVWEGEERKQFVALHFPVDRPLREYMEWKGYSSEDQLQRAQEVYGNNRYFLSLNFYHQFARPSQVFLPHIHIHLVYIYAK